METTRKTQERNKKDNLHTSFVDRHLFICRFGFGSGYLSLFTWILSNASLHCFIFLISVIGVIISLFWTAYYNCVIVCINDPTKTNLIKMATWKPRKTRERNKKDKLHTSIVDWHRFDADSDLHLDSTSSYTQVGKSESFCFFYLQQHQFTLSFTSVS